MVDNDFDVELLGDDINEYFEDEFGEDEYKERGFSADIDVDSDIDFPL